MNNYIASDDKSKLDISAIHSFLTDTYWAKGRTYEEVKISIQYSDCYGIYQVNQQVGFARVLSHFTVFAYLMDVFIIKSFRGKGLLKRLLAMIFEDPKFKHVKKWMLATSDAHSLYEKFGFKIVIYPEKLMDRIIIKDTHSVSNSVDD